MANLVTLSRLLLLFIVVWLMYQQPTPWQLASFFLVILIFLSSSWRCAKASQKSLMTLAG